MPGLSDSTPGHIGQKYLAEAEGWTEVLCSCPQQAGLAGFASQQEGREGLGLREQQEAGSS
jgi:hypothetical protein